MRLCVLGSGGIEPDPQRHGPAYLVETDQQRLLLDLGPGALRQLVRAGRHPDQVTGLCLSHHHPDHHSEAWLFLMLQRNHGRRQPLSILAAAAFAPWLEFHRAWARRQPLEFGFPLHWTEAPGRLDLAGLQVNALPVPHVDGTVGFRLRDSASGAVLAYSADCGPGPEVVELARAADLFVCECTLPPGASSAAHLAPEQAAELARQAGAKRLLLTHLPPTAARREVLAACAAAGMPAQLARDLSWYEL